MPVQVRRSIASAPAAAPCLALETSSPGDGDLLEVVFFLLRQTWFRFAGVACGTSARQAGNDSRLTGRSPYVMFSGPIRARRSSGKIHAEIAHAWPTVLQMNDRGVVWAPSGDAALPDLLITDWHMPGMDGPALCRAFREDATLAPVSIILAVTRQRCAITFCKNAWKL
ncbi:response regulator (plasmid) [Paraburkholderia sp. DD10]|uniref:response regulator n=1 Tax=Paraburkholderia sp. DD10 TaxID=3409691 RepID=UPI003B9EAE6A